MYRNQQDLIFHHVTPQKIHETTCQPAKLQHTISSKASQSDAVTSVALVFLFECYLRGSSFEWVPSLYNTAHSTLFDHVVRATALAAYSYESRRSNLLAEARSLYDNALTHLRTMVLDNDASSDDTLAAVLLMSRFETLLNDGGETAITETWKDHIVGAFTIVQARGDEVNYASSLSETLLKQTIHNYNFYCLVQHIDRPAPLLAATEQLCKRMLVSSKPYELARLELHDLSEAFNRCRRSVDMLGTEEMSRSIFETDGRILAYLDRFARISTYDEHDATQLAHAFKPHSGTYHIYKDHHEARIWNACRMMRLTLHHHLLHLKPGIASSQAVVTGMTNEICASVPWFLHSRFPACTHAAACYLAWPLYVAALIGDDCRPFVREALLFIAREFNISSGEIAAGYLNQESYNDRCLYPAYMF